MPPQVTAPEETDQDVAVPDSTAEAPNPQVAQLQAPSTRPPAIMPSNAPAAIQQETQEAANARHLDAYSQVDKAQGAAFGEAHPFLPGGWAPPASQGEYIQAERQSDRAQAAQARADAASRHQAITNHNLAVEGQMRGAGQRSYTDPNGVIQPILEPGTNKPLYTPSAKPTPGFDPTTKQPAWMSIDKYGQTQYHQPNLVANPDVTDDQLYHDFGSYGRYPAGKAEDLMNSPDFKTARVAMKAVHGRRAAMWKEALAPMQQTSAGITAQYEEAQQQKAALQEQIAQAQKEQDDLSAQPQFNEKTGGILGIGAQPSDASMQLQSAHAAKGATVSSLQSEMAKLDEQIKPGGALTLQKRNATLDLAIFKAKAQHDQYSDLATERRAMLRSQGKPEAGDPTLTSILQAQQAFGTAIATNSAVAQREAQQQQAMGNPVQQAPGGPAAPQQGSPDGTPIPQAGSDPSMAVEPITMLQNGQKSVGGVSVQQLAQRYGSGAGPVKANSLVTMKQRMTEIDETLGNSGTNIDPKLRDSMTQEKDYLGNLYAQRFAKLPPDQQRKVNDTLDKQTTTAGGAAARGAANQIGPGAGAIAGMRVGALAGAAVPGLGETGISEAAGAIIGGIGGAILGGIAQRKALKAASPELFSKLQDYQSKDAEQHPVAQAVGDVAGNAAFFKISPGATARGAAAMFKIAKGEAVTAAENQAAKALAVQSGLATAQSVGTPLVEGEKIQPGQMAASVASMLLFGHPRFGGGGGKVPTGETPQAPTPDQAARAGEPLTPEQQKAADAQFEAAATPEQPSQSGDQTPTTAFPQNGAVKSAEGSADVFERRPPQTEEPTAVKSAKESADVLEGKKTPEEQTEHDRQSALEGEAQEHADSIAAATGIPREKILATRGDLSPEDWVKELKDEAAYQKNPTSVDPARRISELHSDLARLDSEWNDHLSTLKSDAEKGKGAADWHNQINQRAQESIAQRTADTQGAADQTAKRAGDVESALSDAERMRRSPEGAAKLKAQLAVQQAKGMLRPDLSERRSAIEAELEKAHNLRQSNEGRDKLANDLGGQEEAQEQAIAQQPPQEAPAGSKGPAPAKHAFFQEGFVGKTRTIPDEDYYNLSQSIPGHKKNSSVAGSTLEKYGYTLPETPARPTKAVAPNPPEAPSAEPAKIVPPVEPPPAAEPAKPVKDAAPISKDVADLTHAEVKGEKIDKDWHAFSPESGTLGVPREEMPQVKSEHRGALVNFLQARGIKAKAEMVKPSDLKPTQAEFSEKKVQAARDHVGGDRAILVSADGHVIDGHHQWVADLKDNPDTPIKTIRLGAPVDKLIHEVREFPSVEKSEGAAPKPTPEKQEPAPGDKPSSDTAAEAGSQENAKPTAPAEKVKPSSRREVAEQRKLVRAMESRVDQITQKNPAAGEAAQAKLQAQREKLNDLEGRRETGSTPRVGTAPNGESDLLSDIADHVGKINLGGLESDDISQAMQKGAARLLRGAKGGTMPDEAMRILNEAGYKFNSVAEMADAIGKASEGRRKLGAAMDLEKYQKGVEAATFSGERRGKEPKAGKPEPIEKLGVGSEFKVRGEKFSVVDVEEGADGNYHYVVQDGHKFRVPEGAMVHPDARSVKNRIKPSTDFLPPGDEPPSTESGERPTDKLIAKLQAAKFVQPGDGTLGAHTPLSLAHDGALDLAILGIRAGRAIADVVRVAVKRFKEKFPDATDEDVNRLTSVINQLQAHSTAAKTKAPTSSPTAPANVAARVMGTKANPKTSSLTSRLWSKLGVGDYDLRKTLALTRDASDNLAATTASETRTSLENELSRSIPKSELPLAADALGFHVEAGEGGIKTLQEMKAKVENSTKASPKWQGKAVAAIDYAIKNYNRLTPTAELYEGFTDHQVTQEQGAGMPTLKRKNYVPHDQDVDENGWFDGGGGMSPTGASNRKNRVFNTHADSIAAGIDPKSLNALDLLHNRVKSGQTGVGLRGWQDSLKSYTDPQSGGPLAQKPDMETRADGSVYFQPQKGYENEMLGGTPVAVKKEYAGIIGGLTDPSWWSQDKARRAIQSANAAGKSINLLIDTFHLGRLAIRQSLIKGRNLAVPLPSYQEGLNVLDRSPAEMTKMAANGELPASSLPDLLQKKATLTSLTKNGLNIGHVSDAMHQELVSKIPVAGAVNKFIFQKFTRGAMAEAALMEHETNTKSYPDLTPDQISQKTAAYINTRFGNLGRQGIFKSKTAQDIMRMIVLAPQWNEGLMRSELGGVGDIARSVTDAVTGKRLAMGGLGKDLISGTLGIFAANQILNQATRGKFTWENPEEGYGAKMSAWIPDGVGGKGAGFFLNPLGVTAEITHQLLNAYERKGDGWEAVKEFAKSRASAAARPFVTWATGTDALGQKIRPGQMGMAMAKSALPVPIGGSAALAVARGIKNGGNTEVFPGQFQKQAMATVGLKTDSAPSAEQRMQSLAKNFNSKRGVEPQAEFYAGDYGDLTNALRRNNPKDIQDEMQTLLQKKTAADIRKHFQGWGRSPFSGNSKHEVDFIKTLSPEEKQTYLRAQQERGAIGSRAMSTIDRMPRTAVH